MRNIVLLLFIWTCLGVAQNSIKLKTIHVHVALCDNINQGIVPVSKTLGNGQDPKNNLYWGAMYGVTSYYKRSKDWVLISTKVDVDSLVLERLLFKHKISNTYLLADAYDGKYIKNTTIDFLECTAGRKEIVILSGTQKLKFGGSSDLLAYIGHDGLMEFNVKGNFNPLNKNKRDAIILACISRGYFKPYLQQTKANPLVWSTGLMSPEAYTLKEAIDGWILNETSIQVRERAARAYNKYQKCGIRGARNLLVTGY